MSDFTKGPWYVSEAKDARSIRYWIVQDLDTWVETVASVPDCSDEKGIANAHLIAAAPELYEALESVMRASESYVMMAAGLLPTKDLPYLKETSEELREAAQIAHAAMRKARGEGDA